MNFIVLSVLLAVAYVFLKGSMRNAALRLFPARHYAAVGRLQPGCNTAITCMAAAVHHDKASATLASGGKGGVSVYMIPIMKALPTPEAKHPRRGEVTSMAWCCNTTELSETLVFGTSNGYAVVWWRNTRAVDFEEIASKQVGVGGGITSVTWDKTAGNGTRFFLTSNDGKVQIWRLDESRMLRSVFVVGMTQLAPLAAYSNDSSKSLLVLARCTGLNSEAVAINVSTNKLDSDGEPVYDCELLPGSSQITHGSFCAEHKLFVIDNGETGCEVRHLKDYMLYRTYQIPSVRVHRPVVHAALTSRASGLVTGSDSGRAFVFNTKGGTTFDVLHHSTDLRAMVQIVEACNLRDSNLIFTATSDDTTDPYITVWRYKRPRTILQVLRSIVDKTFSVIVSAVGWFLVISATMVFAMVIFDILGFRKEVVATITAVEHLVRRSPSSLASAQEKLGMSAPWISASFGLNGRGHPTSHPNYHPVVEDVAYDLPCETKEESIFMTFTQTVLEGAKTESAKAEALVDYEDEDEDEGEDEEDEEDEDEDVQNDEEERDEEATEDLADLAEVEQIVGNFSVQGESS